MTRCNIIAGPWPERPKPKPKPKEIPCRIEDGVLIPGCMGVAAHYSDLDRTDEELILDYCTCPWNCGI